MKKTIYTFLLLLLFSLHNLSAEDASDDILVAKIADTLIKAYDDYKDRTTMEKIVLRMGKPAYIESINDWVKNYKNLDTMELKLHPIIQKIIKTGDKHLPEDKAKRFRELFEHLSLLGYKNLQVYYITVKEYLKKYGQREIDINVIDDAISEPQVYEEKVLLNKEEEIITKEIKEIFKEEKIKYRLGFYSFAFNFLTDIRAKITKTDMERMLKKINSKNNHNGLKTQTSKSL
jgi:hypothetical protein